MAESNGGGRFDDHAERLAKLEAARKEIEDASLVMSVLESKSASRIKEHAQFIATMEAGMRSHELRIAKQEETSDLLGQRVHALVSAIGDLISHIPPAALRN